MIMPTGVSKNEKLGAASRGWGNNVWINAMSDRQVLDVGDVYVVSSEVALVVTIRGKRVRLELKATGCIHCSLSRIYGVTHNHGDFDVADTDGNCH